jgi:hypothetical protein
MVMSLLPAKNYCQAKKAFRSWEVKMTQRRDGSEGRLRQIIKAQSGPTGPGASRLPSLTRFWNR